MKTRTGSDQCEKGSDSGLGLQPVQDTLLLSTVRTGGEVMPTSVWHKLPTTPRTRHRSPLSCSFPSIRLKGSHLRAGLFSIRMYLKSPAPSKHTRCQINIHFILQNILALSLSIPPEYSLPSISDMCLGEGRGMVKLYGEQSTNDLSYQLLRLMGERRGRNRENLVTLIYGHWRSRGSRTSVAICPRPKPLEQYVSHFGEERKAQGDVLTCPGSGSSVRGARIFSNHYTGSSFCHKAPASHLQEKANGEAKEPSFETRERPTGKVSWISRVT